MRILVLNLRYAKFPRLKWESAYYHSLCNRAVIHCNTFISINPIVHFWLLTLFVFLLHRTNMGKVAVANSWIELYPIIDTSVIYCFNWICKDWIMSMELSFWGATKPLATNMCLAYAQHGKLSKNLTLFCILSRLSSRVEPNAFVDLKLVGLKKKASWKLVKFMILLDLSEQVIAFEGKRLQGQ